MIELLRLHEGAPPRSAIARVFGVDPLCTARRQWYDAAVSEIEVGGALARLGRGWAVLHALPVGVGTTDIDHVAIGPGGVFVINTNNHPGQPVWVSQRSFLVSGIRYPYIRNMEYEMGRAERLIGAASGMAVEVAGIVAIVGAKSITVGEQHRDVTVLATEAVVDWLNSRPVVLDESQIATIAEAAGRYTTWRQGEQPVEQHDDVRERFEAVRSEVRRARRLQVAWAAAITLVGAGGFVLVTYSILLNAVTSLGQ